MKRNVGLWLDHRQAVLVCLDGGQETISILNSNLERQHRLAGGARSRSPFGPQDIAVERQLVERRAHQLHEYYSQIKEMLASADSILIFGPAEAKFELEKELKKSKEIGRRIAGVLPAEKMTRRQIVARVKSFYQEAGRHT